MTDDEPDRPDSTVPFTHRPYGGGDGGDNPFVSPSGPASQPSGPDYGTPVPGQPYQEPWQAAWAPAYGAPIAGTLDHKGATTSLVLGIISVVCLVTALLCCVTIPGVLCAPFAWVIGARAKREIDAAPGTYGNRGSAQTGMIMGIVCSVLGFLLTAAVVAIVAFIGITDWSLV